jgi:hypothetical protein
MQLDVVSVEQATGGFLALYSIIAGLRDKG